MLRVPKQSNKKHLRTAALNQLENKLLPCALAHAVSRHPNSRIHRYDIMGTRRSGCDRPGSKARPSDNTIYRLDGWQVAAEGVSVGVAVRCCVSKALWWLSCAPPCICLLSFCLDWKREGPVFIKVGGSLLPKFRQASRQGITPTKSSAVPLFSNSNYIGFLYILDCYRFGIGGIHNACFVWEKAQLFRNTLRTGFHSCAPHFTRKTYFPFSSDWTIDTKVQIYLRDTTNGKSCKCLLTY